MSTDSVFGCIGLVTENYFVVQKMSTNVLDDYFWHLFYSDCLLDSDDIIALWIVLWAGSTV